MTVPKSNIPKPERFLLGRRLPLADHAPLGAPRSRTAFGPLRNLMQETEISYATASTDPVQRGSSDSEDVFIG